MPSTRARASSTIPYDVHPGVAMVQRWVAELKPKTGRTLEEWIALVKKAGPPTEKERREWLKEDHGHGTNAAWWIAERAEGRGSEDSDPKAYLRAAAAYVEEMYAHGKAALRPVHDAILQMARGISRDVKVCPCKTIVPLYRNHVFAEIKPSTKTRIDLGLALARHKGKLPKRIVDTGGLAKKDRITHRIPIKSVEEVDGEVGKWLRIAYELDA